MPNKKIEVLKYNTNWPKQYQHEASNILEIIGSRALQIYHIGSTAVVGLAAKQEIDVLLVVDSLQNSLLLQESGYVFKGELNVPLRYFFSKNTAGVKINLHVCEAGHGFIKLNLVFRDWLRQHEQDRKAYEALKYKIAALPDAGIKTSGGFSNYNKAKDSFIKAVLKKADHNDSIVNFCMHDSEWRAAKKFRDKYFIEHGKAEPYILPLDGKAHKHLVFYKGIDIVGYLHAKLAVKKRAIILVIVIDEQYQNCADDFMGIIEKWLKLQGYQSMHAQISPATLGFYKRLGFVAMPFHDPDGFAACQQDIAMGKIL